jgi:hypothetical protein
MNDQISFFDIELTPGAWVEAHGRELSFDEITGRVGQIIIMDKSTENHKWFQVVRVEKIFTDYETGQRRLIYYDGGRQRGLVDERYFSENYTGRFPARAYEVT